MSTRALVGLADIDDSKIAYIYVHFDGYPEGLGKTLAEHYSSTPAVEALIALGDASTVQATLDASVFYHRDRGEALAQTRARRVVQREWQAEMHRRGAVYAYLWSPRSQQWLIEERR